MVVASSPNPTYSRHVADSEKLAQLPAPASVKAAWQQAAQSRPSPPSSPSPRSQKRQLPRAPPHPNESFVLLQDSVVRNIPSPLPTAAPTSARRLSYPRSRTTQTPQAPPANEAAQEEVQHPNPSPLSHHLRSTLRLFNLLSSRTDVDHPLCAECTGILLNTLTRQLEETKKERDGYIAFEKDVRREREREGEGMSKEEAEVKIAKLKEEEKLAIEKLQEAERGREQLADELRALELEEKALEDEEAELANTALSMIPPPDIIMQVLACAQRTPLEVRRASIATRGTPCCLCRRLCHPREA